MGNQADSTENRADVPPLAALRFARHVLGVRYADLPEATVAAAKTFLLDSFGVGLAGATAQGAEALRRTAASWGAGADATVWGCRERLPAPQAALVNGFQVHDQEFDCVHEAAVLHPMATLLPAALAYAERRGGVSGQEFLVAVVVGVDVAVGLGLAARSGLRFFRPATSGGFGAVAAVGRLAGLNEAELAGAFGLQYAQTSGTMQPRVEGNMALPLQIGFDSRAAVCACDLAAAGLVGPRDVFEGQFGYLRLFEGTWDLAPVWADLGHAWRIAELSYKPYPAGRATHGGLEGVATLRDRHGFAASEVRRITVVGPPLIQHLCGRPVVPNPSPSYARLCMGFAIAKLLQHGALDPVHFRGAELTDPETCAIGARVFTETDGSSDPNALAPQRVCVELTDGRRLDWDCATMLANPARPLTRTQHLAKFRRCAALATTPLNSAQTDRLVDTVDRLEEVADLRDLAALLTP